MKLLFIYLGCVEPLLVRHAEDTHEVKLVFLVENVGRSKESQTSRGTSSKENVPKTYICAKNIQTLVIYPYILYH